MSFSKETYRPLPEGLTISQSKIDGLGLHALKDFEAGEKFGETHVLVHSRDRHEWIRTPLGGFINHSDNPNCIIQKQEEGSDTLEKGFPVIHFLVTLRAIQKDEELTVRYTTYKV